MASGDNPTARPVGVFLGKNATKKKPKPSRNKGRPVDRFGGLGLPHGYLPIDPTTHAGAAEHQAIRDLIEQRTGRPVPEGMDVGVALREAGLIQAPRRRPFSAGSSSGVFASAVDALDAAAGKTSDWLASDSIAEGYRSLRERYKQSVLEKHPEVRTGE